MPIVTQDEPHPSYVASQLKVTSREELINRKSVATRETNLLPLTPPNWWVYASTADLMSNNNFPHIRFAGRNSRLQQYHMLYEGKQDWLVPQADKRYTSLFVNSYRRVAELYAHFLTSEPIEFEGEDVVNPQDLISTASDLIIDQIRYGGGLLRTGMTVEGEVFVDVVDPQCWYPLMDGGYILFVPFTSDVSKDDAPDRVRVTVASPEGFNIESIHMYTPSGNAGEPLEVVEYANLQFVTPILRSPRRNGWGQSMYDDMAPIVLSESIMLASQQNILLMAEYPILNMTIPKADQG